MGVVLAGIRAYNRARDRVASSRPSIAPQTVAQVVVLVAQVAGIVAVVAGIAMIFGPAAYIVGGVLAIAIVEHQ